MAKTPEAKKKRLVRNPDSFRERAQKAIEQKDRPVKSSRLRRAGGVAQRSLAWKALGPPLRLTGKVLRFITPKYFRNSWRELKLVTWPSWKQSRQLTYAVLVFAIVFGASIALVDYGLDKVFRNILLK